jgi:two-component system chemotaxis sensor kinase CheA
MKNMSATSIMRRNMLRETVKVDSERLDKLLDTIGELVIAETMVVQSQELKTVNSPHLTQTLAQLDKITRELQEMGMALRMVPISGTFQKMARLVRDLSKKIGKDVEFATSGEDTELDKNVVDRIGDPLVHMVRNAIDHGIEKNPDDRVKAGKPAKGRVELRAFHKGGSIHIEIQDDGRGLDRDAILKKAVERGIVQPGAELDDKEVFALIFEPGFSTAERITEVSGRGVGMDVVKRSIEALRGQIDIQSTPGHGSTFVIRLPLTLAIIDGMVVCVGGERYIIPTLSIVMSLCVKASEFKTVQGSGRMIQLQGELIPIFELSRLFDVDASSTKPSVSKDAGSESLVVVVEDDGQKTGIVIDELLGQQQIVIKTLGDYLKGAPGISGGAIMPDGCVGLILDVGGLVRLANS